MSHDITIEPSTLTNAKEFAKIPFDPQSMFAPQLVTIVVPSGVLPPPNLPQSFTLTPEVKNGNIALKVRDVQYFQNNPFPPIWTVQNSILNSELSLSIAMIDSVGDILVLSGTIDPETQSASGTWTSTLLPLTLLPLVEGQQPQATWSSQVSGGRNSFDRIFSWTFLLDETNEDPITVILQFELSVGEIGTIQQIASFPPNWTVTGFDEDDGILLTLTNPNNELYSLESGLFVGGFGALVCQGILFTSSITTAASSNGDGEGDGTWTGTSGGPLAVLMPKSPGS